MSLSTIQYVRFDESSKPHLEGVGVNYDALKRIFLCDHLAAVQCELAVNTPKIISDYQNREARASSYIYDVIRNGYMHFLNPLSLKPVTCSQTEIPMWADQVGSGLFFVPLLYYFEEGKSSFWLVSCDLTARIVLMYIPELELTIYEINSSRAKAIMGLLWRENQEILNKTELFVKQPPLPRFAILDMVLNYGHHIINHLSGLDELHARDVLANLDEILIAGPEFFSDVKLLYPELNHKMQKFEDRSSLVQYLTKRKFFGVKLGSTYFRRQLRSSILSQYKKLDVQRSPTSTFPIIAVNVRSGDRRCLNLVDIVDAIYKHFRRDYPDISFIIDGWVYPDSRYHEAVDYQEKSMRKSPVFLKEELDEVTKIVEKLPHSAVLECLVGLSMSESVNKLGQADLYFSHVGTLQHKLSFFHLLPGLVHGPKDQLRRPDSGSFSSADAIAPIFLAPEMVIDAAIESNPQSRSNYEIDDVQGCLRLLSEVIEEAKSRRNHLRPST